MMAPSSLNQSLDALGIESWSQVKCVEENRYTDRAKIQQAIEQKKALQSDLSGLWLRHAQKAKYAWPKRPGVLERHQ
jgi:hypothetical protein